jgi:hypothetical protein
LISCISHRHLQDAESEEDVTEVKEKVKKIRSKPKRKRIRDRRKKKRTGATAETEQANAEQGAGQVRTQSFHIERFAFVPVFFSIRPGGF